MKYIPLISLFILFSCTNKPNSTLEITFTSKNNDTINVLKSMYLTRINSIDLSAKPQSFHDVKCVVPNKFILQSVDTGLYIGLILIESEEHLYNISCDSILIKQGKNNLVKEINLGTVKL